MDSSLVVGDGEVRLIIGEGRGEQLELNGAYEYMGGQLLKSRR